MVQLMGIKDSKRSCAILQPHYLPWIGYFDMIDRVDVFVFLDDVQFIQREWKNRNRIRKTPTSVQTKWLTVPVQKECHRSLIQDTKISTDVEWQQCHCNHIRSVYRSAPYFDVYFPDIRTLLTGTSFKTISDLNISLILHFCRLFGIQSEFIKSSDINAEGKKEKKLLNICRAVGADFYLANNATDNYMPERYFEKHGIGYAVQNYTHPLYVQRCKNLKLPFLSHLSVIDLIFNCDRDSMETIRGNSRFRQQ